MGLILAAGIGWGNTVVVSTHAVFAEFAATVGGDAVEVVSIIPSGFCPAQYDLRPSDIQAVSRADLILYSGFEPWMEDLLRSVGGDALSIRLTGTWNTPDAAVSKIEAIAAALCEVVPEEATRFAANAGAARAAMEALGASLLARAEPLDVVGVPVIAMEWQEGFLAWLGFPIEATYAPPAGLTMRDLVALRDVGLETGVALVIDNLQSGVDFGAKLAREIGAVHVVLSNFPGAMPDTGSVTALLQRNADALFSAIEPVPSE